MNATQALIRPGVTLADKYQTTEGTVFLSGTQALVLLPIEQRRRDSAAGLNTGGYISGYRGSPLGRYDMELWAADAALRRHNIVFRAAVNEDLAATAIWGAQHVGAFPGATVDGVFGIWYGKGPGVDRSADVFRHANSAGTNASGGVLALAGDDHGAKSSTIANFSDQVFIAAGMPVLYPSTTQELLDFGLHGIAMSRFSGCWVGMKVVTDVVEGGGTITLSQGVPAIVMPAVPSLPAAGAAGDTGLHIRRFDMPLAAEDRLYNHKLYAALAYARANRLNTLEKDVPHARLAVVAAGKAYQDVLQAFDLLGWSDDVLARLGVRVAKIGMTWPLDPDFVQALAHGVETIFVVEEKRPLLEDQLKAILYDLDLAPRASVVGKAMCAPTYTLAPGARLLANSGELSPSIVADALLKVMHLVDPACPCRAPAAGPVPAPGSGQPQRHASFCSGCPHNRSTQVIDGSRALAGIGCHTIAMLNAPASTGTVSHMGGEGVMWLGQQPFTTEAHVFANMGDGTYFHSGFLAIRQAIAARASITYKLLVNGFVSMTGGQPVDGELGVLQMIQQLLAEGAVEIALVSDEPEKYAQQHFPGTVSVHHRDALDTVQRRLRAVRGVTVLLYEQPCATERRRLRKRGKWPDLAKRAFINAAVCEGCGDCGAVSNCLSIEPLETPFGRKRSINQSSCNKDHSCVDGFCPSFVTVHGGALRKPAAAALVAQQGFAPLPEPVIAALSGPARILVGGIGGTGVVTIGQVLGMAAHLDGLACSVLDVTGLSQKYGAVLSHVQIAPTQRQLHATRIAPGQADTVIACDLIVAAGDEAISRMASGRTRVALCTDVIPTAEFSRNPDWSADAASLVARVRERSAGDGFEANGVALAKALMGDTVAANMFMLGAAWQRGWIALSAAALQRAIELNGIQVEFNHAAFLWGRRAAHDLAAVQRIAAPASVIRLVRPAHETLEQIVERSERFLTSYDNSAYARRFRTLVDRVADADARLEAKGRLARAVALSYFKLLAIKDEWEVARLYASAEFQAQLAATFEGDIKLHFHLGVWPFARTDPLSGKVSKAELGPWMGKVFTLMYAVRGLRGTWLDPFRFSAERRQGLRLLADFERDVETMLAQPSRLSVEQCLVLAALPQKIRGYGHVRAASAKLAGQERERLLAAMLT